MPCKTGSPVFIAYKIHASRIKTMWHHRNKQWLECALLFDMFCLVTADLCWIFPYNVINSWSFSLFSLVWFGVYIILIKPNTEGQLHTSVIPLPYLYYPCIPTLTNGEGDGDSLTHSLARSLTHSLTLTHSLPQSHSFTHTHSLTPSLTHSLTHSPTHSLRCSAAASRVAGAVYTEPPGRLRRAWAPLGRGCLSCVRCNAQSLLVELRRTWAGPRLPFVWQAQYMVEPRRVWASLGRGCLSFGSRWPRLPFVWQAQYTEPGLLVELRRAWALLGRGCLSCGRRSTQSLLVELRVWAPLGRGCLLCGRQYTEPPGRVAARVGATGPRLPPVRQAVHRASWWSCTPHLSHHNSSQLHFSHLISHTLTHDSSTSHTSLITSHLTPHLSHHNSSQLHFSHLTSHTLTHHSSTSRTSLLKPHFSHHNPSQLHFSHHLSHTLFDTPSFTHHLSRTQLCHPPSLTHHLSHTTLSHTHNLSHTTLSHTIFHTSSFTHSFVTHHLSHSIFHTHHLSRATLSHIIFPPPPPLSSLPSPSPLQHFWLIIGRSWLVGLSGPFISSYSWIQIVRESRPGKIRRDTASTNGGRRRDCNGDTKTKQERHNRDNKEMRNDEKVV